jgi:cell division protein ZapA
MRSVEVEILGQRYAIKTDEDEAYIKRVAEYIDKKLKEIYTHAPNISHSKAMIMTLFSVTDELFRLRRKQEEIDRMIEEKTRILSGFLE